ncbi:hypothetical protein CYMTET_9745 [Cymbomonas tetramitiformis]|uniref:Uncharacterized protein n=1 Tax=Cymbomonas tetramitiformis TaxID=36881 RepID=A0AAE0GR19_9CHLO|nr:hypothetical protein CYMTET_9745 [Cymbomonas tetramitiformis]
MIDDNDDDNSELLNNSGGDGEDDTGVVSDAPRSVVPRHAPLAGQALGGAPMDPFGGMPEDTGDGAMPASIPPRNEADTISAGEARLLPLPRGPATKALQDPDPPVPDSPPYSPPHYTSDEEEEASTDDFHIEGPLISSTNDGPPTSRLPFGCPVNMLRAGPAIPSPESGYEFAMPGLHSRLKLTVCA